MNLNSFEKDIDKKILYRGLGYCESGYVTDLIELKKGKWSAKVEGTELYTVIVEIEDNEIISSICDCPYDGGPVCKHEVAVYYAIRERLGGVQGKKEDKSSDDKTLTDKLKEILERQDKEELINIILGQGEKDQDFITYLMARYGAESEKVNKSEYKKYIRSFVTRAKRQGFIDYRHAPLAVEGAYQVVTDSETALNKGEHENALKMAQAVIEVIAPTVAYTDDSDGLQGSVISFAFDILLRAAKEGLPEKLRADFFKYCIKESAKEIYSDFSDWLYSFLELASLTASSEKETALMFKRIEDDLKKNSESDYISSYRIEKLSLFKYDLLIRMGKFDEAEKFFASSLHFSGFRRLALDKAFSDRNYDRVIELALEGEERDGPKRLYGLVREWEEWRFKAYLKKNEMDEARELAHDFIVNGSDIEYYDFYKSSFSADLWPEQYETLKVELSGRGGGYFSVILAEVLIKEDDLKPLMEMLKRFPYYVSEYEKYFLETNPDDIYSLYMENIRKEACTTGDRKKYRRICRDIKRLGKIGGKAEAALLIHEFRQEYNNRPAFMDELSKIKL